MPKPLVNSTATQILLAPPGAGKTEFALQQLHAVMQEDGWAQVHVLLPNALHEAQFRRRLLARAGAGDVIFNMHLWQFDGLARWLLRLASQPVRVLQDAECKGILRALLTNMAGQGELPIFSGIADTPGLLRAVADFLDDLQRNLVTPAAFAAAARSERDRELARIVTRYRLSQSEQGVTDRPGALELAREALPEAAMRRELVDVNLLLVDGFDRFTPLQASVLMQLADCVQRALITLPWAPGREATVGARFQETLTLLRDHSPQPPQVDCLPASPAEPGQGLQQLVERVFRHDARPLHLLPQLQLVEAPGPQQEARAITRRIKVLLLETDAQPEDCLVVVPDWQRYARPLRSAGREHGVPLDLQPAEALTEVPSILYLLKLLQLPGTDFPRQELLDVLGAICFALSGLGPEQVAQLERISRERRLRGGRAAWLAAVSESDLAAAEALAHALRDFMDAVTPPVAIDHAGLWRWLRRLCGFDDAVSPDAYTLDMPGCLPPEQAGELRKREDAALAALDKLLRNRSRDSQLLEQAPAGTAQEFETFLRELRAALATTKLEVPSTRAGRVLVTRAATARGLTHCHVFIPGLSTGIFPRQAAVNPLHLGSERVALAERGADLGEAEAAGDDTLFYQLPGQARDSLTLTRPTVENGTPLGASHLWQALREVCPQQPVTRIRPGAVPGMQEVAAVEEALVALAAEPDAAHSAALRCWLQREQNALLAQVAHAQRVEAGRMSRYSALNHYAGVLTDTQLIAQIVAGLGPQRAWSATQLNDLGACRYRFFAGRILKLEELPQPDPILNALELGKLNHALLERVYRALAERGLTIEAENLDEALSQLTESAQQVFDEAPLLLQRPLDELWPWEQQALRARLESFVRRDFSGDSPVGKNLPGSGRRARWQELRFGMDDDYFCIPLMIDGRTEDLRLRGMIDRVDEVDGQLLVLDYKSGSTGISQDELREAVNVQMLVYLRAAEHLLAQREPDSQIEGGMFLHLRSLKSSGWIQPDVQTLRDAEGRISENIAAARRGDFSVQPRLPDASGRCTRYCEFSQLCRVAVTQAPAPETGS